MLTIEQTNFYTRWRNKGEAMDSNGVEEAIDKYVTLFITFNFLYNPVPEKMVRHRNIVLKKVGDKESATLFIQDFLGSQNILSYLNQNGCDADIIGLANILRQKHFNIVLDRLGVPKPKEDEKLLKHLQSTNEDEKSLAILEILYYVRCNVVHGRKGLQEYQTLLLVPVINILSKINHQLFQALTVYPV